MPARSPRRPARPAPRRGAALILAVVVAALCVLLTVGLLDAARLRARAVTNTRDHELCRYAAEAGLHRGLAELERDITWRTGVSGVPFPRNLAALGLSSRTATYAVTAADGPDGTVLVRATATLATPRGSFTRVLTATVKQGG